MQRRVRVLVSGIARSRLLWFGVLGALLFLAAPREARDAKIALRGGDVRALHAAQASKLGVRDLPPALATAVDARAIEDEVLYREALRLGLDRDDALVRQHLVQKTLMMAEDLGGGSRAPSDAEVRAFFEAHAAAWRAPESVHLVHVFASTRERAEGFALEAQRWQGAGAPPLGDAFPQGREITTDHAGLAAAFDDAFARAACALETGVWSAPLQSRFGWHLVRVTAREPARPASFEEVAPRLRFELQVQRRRDAVNAFLKRALARYEVELDGVRVRELPESTRLASRVQGSAED